VYAVSVIRSMPVLLLRSPRDVTRGVPRTLETRRCFRPASTYRSVLSSSIEKLLIFHTKRVGMVDSRLAQHVGFVRHDWCRLGNARARVRVRACVCVCVCVCVVWSRSCVCVCGVDGVTIAVRRQRDSIGPTDQIVETSAWALACRIRLQDPVHLRPSPRPPRRPCLRQGLRRLRRGYLPSPPCTSGIAFSCGRNTTRVTVSATCEESQLSVFCPAPTIKMHTVGVIGSRLTFGLCHASCQSTARRVWKCSCRNARRRLRDGSRLGIRGFLLPRFDGPSCTCPARALPEGQA
jgi:hypothetical protein